MITPSTLQRREYKYLVTEDTVERVRRYIAGFCVADAYAAATGRYVIDTLYLDTPRLDSYRATVDDAGDRYKLRVRRYPEAVDSPVFLEVKRRIAESILKTRGAFAGDWARLLDGDPGALAQIAPKHRRGIDNFLCHHRYLPFGPTALVRYEREPYFSLVDDYARVTFDRSLAFQPASELSLVPAHERWTYVDDAVSQRSTYAGQSVVLLELKFTNVVPHWMRHMVHTLDLQRLAFCKYTRAIDAMRAVPGQRVARAGLRR